ncbi:MAG: protein-disulfide reductase DsbD domain-containing protein, partial [Parachlamydiaceae bacterium]
MKTIFSLFLALIVIISPVFGSESAPAAVQLIAENELIAPGDTFRVLISFELDPSWHLYWKNPGDAGMAPTVEWQLPPSVTLVSEEWPVPQKFDHEGLITFGYAETLPLMATLRLDPHFQGNEVEFQTAVSWVICSQDTCLPGSQALSYKVSVGKGSQKGDLNKKVFADADAKLPKKLSPIFVEKSGEEFKIALPISKIDHLEFFPEPDLGFDHHAPLTIDRNASEDYTLITLKTDQGKLPRSLGVLVADQTA